MPKRQQHQDLTPLVLIQELQDVREQRRKMQEQYAEARKLLRGHAQKIAEATKKIEGLTDELVELIGGGRWA